jgi:nucleotide-binding universal stress UspA family protein
LGFEDYVSPNIPDLAIQQAQEYVQTVISVCSLQVKYEAQVLVGIPHTKILEIANTEAVQAIIMYRHLYPNLKSWVFGEISARIIQNASCPVILVTPNTKAC